MRSRRYVSGNEKRGAMKQKRHCSRCYLRGLSPLGLFNTIVGCLLNRVLVKRVDRETKRIVGWFWAKAINFPRKEAVDASTK